MHSHAPTRGGPLPATGHGALELSVVAPAHNEEANIPGLVAEVGAALEGMLPGVEFVIVDDGSTDGTRAAVVALMPGRPWLRCVSMQGTPSGSGHGQSAAFHAGFRASRGRLLALLDADLQNDPADLPAMLELMSRTGADLIQGDRSHARKDSLVRRGGSVVGRAFRRLLLADCVRDTGCSLRVMTREVALALPLEFKGMHRFIPATAASLGFKVVEMRVSHRPRCAGETKYGMGITKRALPGLVDCFAVRWMRTRRRPVIAIEVIALTAAPETGEEHVLAPAESEIGA